MRFTFRAALVVVLSVGAVACDSGGTTGDSANPVDQTALPGNTTVGENPIPPTDPSTVYPLTGLPITDEAAAARQALEVKIDNDTSARPQSGLNAADIVFEQIFEAQTRLVAVFQSQGSGPVFQFGRHASRMLI